MRSEYSYKEVEFAEEVLTSAGKHIIVSARRVRGTGGESYITLQYGEQSIEFDHEAVGDKYEEHAYKAMRMLEDAFNDPCSL